MVADKEQGYKDSMAYKEATGRGLDRVGIGGKMVELNKGIHFVI